MPSEGAPAWLDREAQPAVPKRGRSVGKLPYTGNVLGGYGRGLVLALALGGWLLTLFVVIILPVTPTAQAVLYAAAFAALSGSWALIRELYAARRLPPTAMPGSHSPAISFLGSGMRFAATVEFGMWLQTLRMLTPVYMVLLLITYLFLEYLFRAAENRAAG